MNQKSNGPDETSGSYCAATRQSKVVPERRAPTGLAGALPARILGRALRPWPSASGGIVHLFERKRVGWDAAFPSICRSFPWGKSAAQHRVFTVPVRADSGGVFAPQRRAAKTPAPPL